jgi:Ca2+-binding RTX toxin-like protein
LISDFDQGVDLIDLSGIVAGPQQGAHSFTFMGTAAHTGTGGTLRYVHSGGNTVLYGDVSGNGAGDFALEMTGLFNLTAADFTNASIGIIRGTGGADQLLGAPGGNLMIGLSGDDTVLGGTGNDTIRGNHGADMLSGGLGFDRFSFVTRNDSGATVATRDRITDFQQGIDLIDLSQIDANTQVGKQAFTFLGTAAHTGAGATLRYVQSGGETVLFADFDGDSTGDFSISLQGTFDLTAADFTNASIIQVRGGSGADVLVGSPGGKAMLGLDGNDVILGATGADTIIGGTGNDTVTGDLGQDRFAYSTGDIGGGGGQEVITDFQQGVDLIDLSRFDALDGTPGVQAFSFLGTAAHSGFGGTLRYVQTASQTIIYGDTSANGAGNFAIALQGRIDLTAADFTDSSIRLIQGTAGNDVLTGASGGNIMLGRQGNDTITGGSGNDEIRGNLGADDLTGGLGIDHFAFGSALDSGAQFGSDEIQDFMQGVDIIDLSDIDAFATTGVNDAFTFVGNAAHSGSGATLRYIQSAGDTFVYGDTTGDGYGDFALRLDGTYSLNQSDFLL